VDPATDHPAEVCPRGARREEAHRCWSTPRRNCGTIPPRLTNGR
jgi:hypothetical protein